MMVIEQGTGDAATPGQWPDRDLEMICLKCLQKASSGYASAAELAADLEAYLAGEASSSQPAD